SNATGIQVGRSIDGTNFTTIATLAATATTYADTGLSEGVHYYYQVTALPLSGTGASMTADAWTPLLAASGLTASVASAAEIDLTWVNHSAVAVNQQVDRSTNGTDYYPLATLAPSATTYADTGLSEDLHYYYQVRAINAASDSSAPTSSDAWTPPAAPSGLTATSVSSSEIDLAWSSASIAATQLEVQRSTDGVTFNTIATLDALAIGYRDMTCTESVHYWYRVLATDGARLSAPGTDDAWAIPAAPIGASASAVSGTQINLQWTNTTSSATAGVQINRADDGIDFAPLATMGPGVTSYADTSAVQGMHYWYQVEATAPGVVSSPATADAWALPANVPGLNVTTVSAGAIDFTWPSVPPDATSLALNRAPDGTNFAAIATLAVSARQYNDTDAALMSGTHYWYQLVAAEPSGNTVIGSIDSWTLPLAPSGLAASNILANQIALTWVDNSSQTSSFKVYRSTDGGATYTPLATVPASGDSYVDAPLPANAHDYYEVSALVPSGASPLSAPADAVAQSPALSLNAIAAASYSAGDAVTLNDSFDSTNSASTHTATVTWGDGITDTAQVSEQQGSGSVFATHTYAVAGNYQPTLVLTGSDATTAQATASVTVTNNPPVLAPLTAQTVSEGASVNLATTFTDGDVFDTHAATISWGDGTTEPADLSENGGSGGIVASHMYATSGTFNTTVTITDSSGASASSSANTIVTSVAPTADAGAVKVEGTAGVPITLDGNYTDPVPGDPGQFHWLVTNAASQQIAADNAQTITFTPPVSGIYYGYFTVTDSDGRSATSTATIAAADPNAPPDTSIPAAPTNLLVSSCTPDGVTLQWQNNATNADGVEIEWSSGTGDTYAIDVVGAGASSYTDMDPLLNRDNVYSVVAFRGDYESSPSATVLAHPVSAPTTFDDDNAGGNARGTLSPFQVVHGHTLSVAASGGLLANDMNLNGDPYQITGFTQPANGALAVNPDGSFTYTPNSPNWIGTDTFTYTAANASETGTPTIVAIDVTDAAPVAISDLGVNIDQSLYNDEIHNGQMYYNVTDGQLAVSDADNDALTYKIIDAPKHGTAQVDPATGEYFYSPDTTFAGTDSFTFSANDGVQDGPAGSIQIVSHLQMVAPDRQMTMKPGDIAADTLLSGAGDEVFFSGVDHGTITLDPAPGTGPHGGAVSFNDLQYASNPSYTGTYLFNVAQQRGNLIKLPWTYNVRTYNPIESTANEWSAGGSHLYYPVPSDSPSFFPDSYTSFLPPSCKDATLVLGQDASHGHVTLNNDGSFRYVPKPDPATGKPYAGWDFFSFKVREGPVTQVQWVQLDVGYTPPGAPDVNQADWRVQAFPRSLDGLWNSYNDAHQKLGAVMQRLAEVGEESRVIAASGSDPTESMLEDAMSKLDALNSAYTVYAAQAIETENAAAEYLRHVKLFYLQSERDVIAAVQALPIDVAGLKLSPRQLIKWEGALGAFGSGADFLAAQATLNVEAARETHDALEQEIQIVGTIAIGANFAVTGAELLTEQGCAAFAKQMTAKVVQNLAAGVAASYASSGAVALARTFGVNEDGVRIGADLVQVLFLIKAARAERKALGANCFVAGTQVLTAGGGTPIEQLKVGDRVLTQVADPSAPGAPQNATGDPNATAVDPATWRDVTLDMPDPKNPGNDYQMQLLEPLSWIGSENARAGGWINLSLPELQIGGEAQVVSIGVCPTVAAGTGRVVLGTFQHVSNDIVGVHLAGETRPLQVTAGHMLWSLDRAAWVNAGDLRDGERLADKNGASTVLSVIPESTVQTVYNLDVETDHRYLVTSDGVVAHNVSPCTNPVQALEKSMKLPNWARQQLRYAMENEHGSAALAGNEAHHGIPLELLKDSVISRFIRLAAKGGFDFNGTENGIITPAGHGPHPEYTAHIRQLILDGRSSNSSPQAARGLLDLIVQDAAKDVSYWF
ncbi:MAG TPA: Ig-like domain-containing protein, partial [Tepidisphaeraceae bacterium]|nr:Ig-like domain-containing protein [Tepidisphaeraceae bacterium]